MIVTLIGQEKNLGILTLTDHLISFFGKDNVVVLGCNYLQDEKKILEKISEIKNKKIILKYITPKEKFSNAPAKYPEILNNMCEIIFKVPTYREELAPEVPTIFYKKSDEKIEKAITSFYGK